MYQEFSGIYDQMMSEIPYDEWFEKLHQYIKTHGCQSGHMCELGCGTGEMTGRFCDAGYEVTGIDISPDMLALAQNKKRKNQKILYLNQDMTDFSLHKPADVVLCICDSLNYLLEEQELLDMFCCVYDNLAPEGLFVFDMKTEYCFQNILGDGIRVEDTEDYTVIWDNQYDKDERINEYLLTMFVRQPGTESYDRYDECHHQRAYVPGEIKELLGQTGFVLQGCFGADFRSEPETEDERLYFAAKKG